MSKINTLIFDIGNVLVDFCWQDAVGRMKLDENIAKRLVDATIKSQTWNEFDRGILSEEELTEEFISNDPDIKDIILLFLSDYYKYIVKQYDYANEWIDSFIKKGYKVYFLSNFSERGHRVFAEDLNFLEKGDGAVLSYKVKLIKPDTAIYQLLIDMYDISPDEAVFIDDTAVNVLAAKSVGLNAITFTDREAVIEELKKMGVE